MIQPFKTLRGDKATHQYLLRIFWNPKTKHKESGGYPFAYARTILDTTYF